MKRDTPEPWPPSLSSIFFLSFLNKLLPLHFRLFLNEINTPLSGQISVKTW